MTQEDTQSVSLDSAKQLSIATVTKPQLEFLTPRYLLRALEWIDVPTGTYRVNKVKVALSSKPKFELILNEQGKTIISANLLKQFYIFHDVPSKVLTELAKKFKHEKINAGESVTKIGDISEKFYIITDGHLEVSIRSQFNNRVVVNILKPGDFFGESALLDSSKRPFNIDSIEQCNLLSIDVKKNAELVKQEDFMNQIKETIKKRTEMRNQVDTYGEKIMKHLSEERGEAEVPKGYIEYSDTPRQYHLHSIQSTVGIHTRIKDLFNKPIDQLEQQLHITIQGILEQQESEMINHREFGLLHNIDPKMTISTRRGPPTPDDLDNLLALVWREPTLFLAHPTAISAFGRECTKRGVPPKIIDLYGSQFLSWRGIPLIPSNKVKIEAHTGEHNEKTDILLLRIGKKKQGVVGLHNESLSNSDIPSLVVRYMDINEQSIVRYMISKYFSLAVLTTNSAARLTNVEVGNYHSYD